MDSMGGGGLDLKGLARLGKPAQMGTTHVDGVAVVDANKKQAVLQIGASGIL